MLISVLLSLSVDLLIKTPLSSIPAIQIITLRAFFIVFILGVYFKFKSKSNKKIGGKKIILFLRGFFGWIGFVLAYYLITKIPLGNLTTFIQSATLFGAVFSLIFLKEKLSKIHFIFLILGFVGIILVIQPSLEFSIFELLGVCTGVFMGLTYTCIRYLRNYYDSSSMVFYSFFIHVICGGVSIIIFGFVNIPELEFLSPSLVPLNIKEWMFILFVTLFTMFSNILKTKAFSYSSVNIIGTIGYSRILFAVIAGTLMGDVFPDISVILGMVLIVIAGIGISRKLK
ncbi:MAG: EamA family transporter [uncultured Campylobacterales bacterium]|uniref:EamA family transporter n=1 Tax=uncultured Campylobacterales bacterium TaxID=352960 RepID=A0A6S6SRH3_9BACT|nr:MAG: EamA family transporter [uncultured Campylobacterales bacterium]